MRRELSSRSAWIYRWAIPAFLTVGAIASIWVLTIAREPTPAGAAAAACLAGLCMIVARIFDRAKRVWLAGNELIVSDLRNEIVVAVTEINEVSLTPWFRPARLRIKLLRPTVFGDTIYFFPPLGETEATMHLLRESRPER